MHLAENIDLVSGVTGGVMVGLSSTILMYATGTVSASRILSPSQSLLLTIHK